MSLDNSNSAANSELMKEYSKDTIPVPSMKLFRKLNNKREDDEKNIYVPYLYQKELKKGKIISYQKSNPDIHFPFVPPYTYMISKSTI